ncbi:MAG TPA: hypothetical protein EYQ50_02850 [Verrucomicrobiales bacterium]|jgi:hypothetical protein|nr:hypothetical protein [Verrucomicrobiales bacterium]HIL70744.1 hypothetical protein [Verrucomicrobiota bacterium]
MNDTKKNQLSPQKLISLGINGVCFGGCIVLLAIGKTNGPLVLLTIGTGLSFVSLLTSALLFSRAQIKKKKASIG